MSDSLKKAYLALKNDGSEEYFKKVKKLLPQLLEADVLKDGEVGVAFNCSSLNFLFQVENVAS